MGIRAHRPEQFWPGSELQRIIDSTPALIHTARPDGYHDFFNETCLNYVGCTLEDLQGTKWSAVIHPEDVEGMVNAWHTSVASGDPFLYEARVRRADGQYRWMLHQKVAVRNEQQKIVNWYGMSIDIEDHKRAEVELTQELRRREAYLAEAQRLSRTGSFGWKPDTGEIVWSGETYRIFGYERFVKPTIDSVVQRVHPEDRELVQQQIDRAIRGSESFDFEHRLQQPDGSIKYVHVTAHPSRASSGDLEFVGAVTDITRRHQAESVVRERERELREILNLTPQHVAVFDPDGRPLYANQVGLDYLGIGIDQWRGESAVPETTHLIHPDDRDRFVGERSGGFRAGVPFELEARMRRHDGEFRSHLFRLSPLKDAQARVLRWYGTAIDIEDLKRAEKELRRSEAYLAEAQRLSHTGSFGWKPDTGEILWSDETYRIFGYERSVKPTIDSVVQRVHPEDRADTQKVIDGASQGAKDFEHTYRLLLPDGRLKHVHAVAHALVDASGNREFVGAVTDITHQRHAEEALQQNQFYLSEGQRLALMGSWAFDATGFTYWSSELFQVYGLDPHGKPPTLEEYLALVHPEDRAFMKQGIAKMLDDHLAFDFTKRIVRPDGEIRHIRCVGVPVTQRGIFRGFVGTGMDVTEQQLLTEELERQREHLTEAQKLAHTGSWIWHLADQSAVQLSEEWYRIFGFNPAEGAPTLEEYSERVHPEDRLKWKSVTERAIVDRADYEHEFRILLPNGIVKWIHTVGHPVLSDTEGLKQFVGSSTDITERKQAEEELRRSEMELRQMLDLAPQHIFVLEADGNPLHANRAALEYFGATMDQWRDDEFRFGLAHPDDLESYRSEKERRLPEGIPHEFEMRFRRHDAKFRWFLVRRSPVKDEQGKTTRWYVSATDIDDRKQAEDRLRSENVALREEIDKASMFEEIVGTSPALQTVTSLISKVAKSDSTVLITGETGTGKELVARAIHRRSNRSSRSFVSVNCAAIPRDLIASELFGHEKGAFTGATQQRLGRFELANGGTLFLDEAGELPAETQIALLRVLQEHEFERVGGTRPIRADVRVIAATNRDLQTAISAGSFRNDLYYRLNVFPIEIPALRERKQDIPLLVEYFIDRYARKAGKKITTVDKKTLQLLESYPWPGNIRELQNVIERSIIVCEGENFSVDESWLSRDALPTTPRTLQSGASKAEVEPCSEREIIEGALAESRGRVSGPSGAAAKLGIPPTTLDHRIKILKIDKRRFKFV